MRDSGHPLQAKARPDFESGDHAVRLADVYCGSGGLTLGVAQAAAVSGLALDVALAIDFDKSAAEVYAANFPKAVVEQADIDKFLSRRLGVRRTVKEAALLEKVGAIDALVGGPPCQGHSDLNNFTRRDDPRNEYYLRMVRAAEVMEPEVVLIENVPPVQHSKTEVVRRAREALTDLGYDVCDQVISLHRLGVPQTRRRHILLATSVEGVSSEAVLAEVTGDRGLERDLRWAIGDLAQLKDGIGLDRRPRPSADNVARMHWLLDNDTYDLPDELRPPCHRDKEHSYRSMYGRLRWTSPAQTITSGFGSIGQGRYMHPDLPRALTAHEAARIQGFPDYFDFSAVERRSDVATMIANAVPPQFASAVFGVLFAAGWLSTAADRGLPGQEIEGLEAESSREALH